jgi:hypothetical protein
VENEVALVKRQSTAKKDKKSTKESDISELEREEEEEEEENDELDVDEEEESDDKVYPPLTNKLVDQASAIRE